MSRKGELIPWKKHKEDCPNPIAKRLYVRDYDKNGKQRFVPWGAICDNCKVIVQLEYEHGLTKNQLEAKKRKEEFDKQHPGYKEREDKIMERIFGPRRQLSQEERDEIQHRNMEYRKNRKLQQIKRRMLPGGRMSGIEMSYRQRIRGLKRMYENDCWYYKALGKLIHWDQELVEKYLATRPSAKDMLFILHDLSPLRRDTMKRARKVRGWIPDPETTKRKRDGRQWYKKQRYNSDPNVVGEYEKMIMRECEAR